MKEQIDDFQKFIMEEFNKEGEEIERTVMGNPEVAGIKADNSVKEKLDSKIEAYEEERRQELINLLSEEDREALALGREIQEREAEEKKTRAAKRRKVVWKRLGAVAAVVALVLTVGITGVGGPKRLVEVARQFIGGREITKVNSDTNDILSSEGAKEEEAYQQIKEKLGFMPVKIIRTSDSLKFKDVDIDEYLKTAQLLYFSDDKLVSYIINSSYVDDSWGIDIEDNLLDEYQYSLAKSTATIRKYELNENKEVEYVAQFDYMDIHYQLVGIMENEEFEEILDNLHFY